MLRSSLVPGDENVTKLCSTIPLKTFIDNYLSFPSKES